MPGKSSSPNPHPDPGADLRTRAEERLREFRRETSDLPPEEVRALVHELRVHQAELEIQNEELRTAQVELAESRDRFSDLYEFAPVGYVSIDAEGIITEANLAAAELLGADRKDLVAGHLEKFISDDCADDFYLHRNKVLVSDEKQTCEMRMKRRDETGTLLTIRLESIAHGTGTDRGCRIALIDITRLRETEKSLEDANRLLRRERDFSERLVETAPSLILVLDPVGRVIRFNPAFERLSGRSLSDSVGRDWFAEFLHDPDRHRLRKAFEKAIRDGDRIRGMVGYFRTKDNGPRQIEWFDAPLTGGAGELIGLLWTGTDVTERFRFEQDLHRLTEKEKERIARDLHDSLGSRLTGIGYRASGLSRKLREGMSVEPEEAETILEQIREAIVLVRGFSHGLQPVTDEPGALEAALEELADWVETSSDLSCRFVASVGESAAAVSISDPVVSNHLYRIAQEAAANAIRHSGAARLSIRLEQDAERILLRIADDGVGFDPPAGASCEKGIGHRTMEYRTRAIGGELAIRPGEKGGTVVECEVGSV